MYALIQDNDFKSQEWKKHLENNIELVNMDGSPIFMVFHLINQMYKRRKKPKAIVLRYLNDYNSLFKSILRFISDILLVLVAKKLLKIKLVWICHNVDKESKEFYPMLVKIRRKIVINQSDKILVIDKLLTKHAAHFLNVKKSKIDYVTFGKPNLNENSRIDTDLHKKILDFVNNNNDKSTLVGFSIGNINRKVLQPFYSNQLIENAKKNGINIKIILGGPIGDYIKNKDLETYNKLLTNPNILFLDGKININERYISQFIDFFWRVYDDYSVPFTVYNAVYLNKPILTMEKGFLNEMVLEYGLGSVLKNDMSNIEQAINGLKTEREDSFEKFIKSHNWKFGAQKLFKNIIE